VTAMEHARVREVHSCDEWESLLVKEQYPSFLQSWEWGELKQKFGWNPVRLAVSTSQGDPAASVQMLIKSNRLFGISTQCGIGYIPHGPFGQGTRHAISQLLEVAIGRAKQQGAAFVRVEPVGGDTDLTLVAMGEAGFRPAPHFVQNRSTGYVELGRTEDELIASFKPKTRYNVRLSMRRKVDVRIATDSADLESFYRLTVATGHRDGFAVHSSTYYRAVWDAFGNSKRHLFIASVNGEDVSAVFVVICGTMATYLYGASSNHYRNTMSTYLLQWTAMRWAKQQGCLTYDFWGMADGAPDRDPMAGVHRFKEGFRPIAIRHAGTFDLPLNTSLYFAITRIALPTRTLIQGVISGRGGPPQSS